ncbi:MAG: response regulator [Acidobacteriota bacterium]|nr:response regulator [Acidobacteriota bacterium]
MPPELSTPIRILVVDDHPAVRAGLTSMLSTYPDLKVVGSAVDGDQAISLATELEPDIVMLDLRMPHKDGIETLLAFRQLSIPAKVIVLTSYESDEEIYQSVRFGAQGYLLKASPEEDMIEAIHTVFRGERYLPTDIASRFADRMPRARLNSRHTAILDLISRGMTDEQVSLQLNITSRDVWEELNEIIKMLESTDEESAAVPASKPKITIAEVARRAGVSMATVSRVLNNSGKHTEGTRRAVMKVVKEYDFQLNGTAASLAMMRHSGPQD